MTIENVKCPKCDGPMVSRKSSYGIFWGCENFPECDGTRDSMGRSKEERDADIQESKTKERRGGW
jgi:ssDNA-binding Zn-finger/Zn-ribbon topoisomerase 1